jgi:hypothetical protein
MLVGLEHYVSGGGGSESAGIGTGKNGFCGWVTIENGSVDARGATGIGSGSIEGLFKA